jgi:hypothetical protein
MGFRYYVHTSNYPSDRQLRWTEEIQGVAHDEQNWFISQVNGIWKIPASYDLGRDIPEQFEDIGISHAPFASGIGERYDHIGDIDCFGGYIFVPVEDNERDVEVPGMPPKLYPQLPAKVAVYAASTLAFVGSAELQQGRAAPWIAVNPTDGRLYSSNDDSVGELLAYRYSIVDANVEIALEMRVNLRDTDGSLLFLDSIQGGSFSPDGTLYLSCEQKGISTRGIHIFSMPDGTKLNHVFAETDSWFQIDKEIQGMTYWSLEQRNTPKISGELHMMELNNDWPSRDNVHAFWHFREFLAEFIGNRRSKEVHRFSCSWVRLMKQDNVVPFENLADGLRAGFDGCRFCLADYDHG